MRVERRRLLLAGASLMLAACAHRPGADIDPAHEAAQRAREAALREAAGFALAGRIGVNNGRSAGSANFDWQQHETQLAFELRIPLSGATWRLSGRPGGYLLDDGKGGTRGGRDASELLTEATGWQIPVDALQWWVRGARAPGGRAILRYDADGRPAELQQHGWTLRYRAWDPTLGLPTRLIARRGTDEVRVAVLRWDPASQP
ncbi:MAG: lipoprotein insertase outer membrane protein LolB [Xanthomonadales bacterium]|jgi:outer membrane lipoprotein LolB|nr:lipoprotein insertase outer membrane protein LolB [Xanthomonadales bacterium]